MGAARVSSDRRAGREDVAHTRSGVLFGRENSKTVSSAAARTDPEIAALRDADETKTDATCTHPWNPKYDTNGLAHGTDGHTDTEDSLVAAKGEQTQLLRTEHTTDMTQSAAPNMPANLETQPWPQAWRKPASIPKAKECPSYRTLALVSHASKAVLKILQARLQQYVNQELPDVQAGFRKGKGTRLPTPVGS